MANQRGERWRLQPRISRGRIEKAVILGKATTVRVFSDATWERSEGVGAEMAVTVNRTMTVSVPGSVRTNEPLTLTGSIRPRSEGAVVQVEKLVGKQWQLVGQPVTTDAQGAFTLTLGAQPRGYRLFELLCRQI